MAELIPTFETVRERLLKLSHQQLQNLAAGSGVPYPTLIKIRNATTTNPGLVTVGKIRKHDPAVEAGWDGGERRSTDKQAA